MPKLLSALPVSPEVLREVEAYARAEIASCGNATGLRMQDRAQGTLDLVKRLRLLEVERLLVQRYREPEVKPLPFSEVFTLGCEALGLLSDEEAAFVFDVPIPTIGRWKSGKVVPPIAGTVLGYLRDIIFECLGGGI